VCVCGCVCVWCDVCVWVCVWGGVVWVCVRGVCVVCVCVVCVCVRVCLVCVCGVCVCVCVAWRIWYILEVVILLFSGVPPEKNTQKNKGITTSNVSINHPLP